jgi:hypothetical protein
MSSTPQDRRIGAEQTAPRSDHFQPTTRSVTSARLERFALFLSYVHLSATITATVLCAELLFSDSPFGRDIGFWSRTLLPVALFGLFNIPFCFRLRSFGIRKLHFLEHEARLGASRPSSAVSRAKRTGHETYRQIFSLIRAIDAADGWDRQAVRATAKAWLIANRFRLDDEARAYLHENVAYLLPDELAPSHAGR